jgi:hypothetical protein
LKAGARIWRWVDGKRQVATVVEVVPLGQVTDVFNLVFTDSRAFIANDFVVRSKPPALAAPQVGAGDAADDRRGR